MPARPDEDRRGNIEYMSTILFSSPIFGPVHSRRLGVSLGVNLLPADGKLCTFDCIYCECGFNGDHRTRSPYPHTRGGGARVGADARTDAARRDAAPT